MRIPGNRLPLLKRDDLDDYGKSVYDELAKLGGNPAPLRLYSPKLAKTHGRSASLPQV